ADLKRYVGQMAPDGVFLGTDATERWTRDQFEAFAKPYFEKGKGWTYRARDRHVTVSGDGSIAWFDELLDSESYGECRGTGCVVKAVGGWKIAQYSLSIPIPNDLAKEFVGRIREFKAKK